MKQNPNQTRKPGSGGPRQGAGRPKTNTKPFTIRHTKTVIDAIKKWYTNAELRQYGRTFLDDLKNKIPPTKQK